MDDPPRWRLPLRLWDNALVNIGTNVYLRKVVNQDQSEFLQLMRASMDMHRPWITPPTTPQMFRNYLQRIRRSDH